MSRRLAIAAALMLAMSACTPGDIDLVLEEFGNDDLAASEDPAVRSAGESAVGVLAIREAEENIDLAFGTENLAETEVGDDIQRIQAIERAQELRPGDPKYELYEMVFRANQARGDLLEEDQEFFAAEHDDASRRAAEKLASSRPELTSSERARVMHELYMDTMLDVIRTFPDSPVRDGTIETYCLYVNELYPQFWVDKYPAESSFYLATSADRSVC